MPIIFAVVLLMSTALSNLTRANALVRFISQRPWHSYNTTTKIIGITLTTRRITTEDSGNYNTWCYKERLNFENTLYTLFCKYIVKLKIKMKLLKTEEYANKAKN
jgi:hypothetical protein